MRLFAPYFCHTAAHDAANAIVMPNSPRHATVYAIAARLYAFFSRYSLRHVSFYARHAMLYVAILLAGYVAASASLLLMRHDMPL